MKKLLAALIAALFVLGMAIPASAEFDINLRGGVAVVATCVQLEEGGDMRFGWGTGFFVGEEGKDPDSLHGGDGVLGCCGQPLPGGQGPLSGGSADHGEDGQAARYRQRAGFF